MQDQSFEQMLSDSLKEIHVGETVEGEVISVTPRQIALNIGYKADGIVSRADYSNDLELDLTTVVKVGDKLEVKVKKLNDGDGQVVLSRKDIIESLVSQRLKELFESGGIKKGKVTKVTKGGLIVEIEPDVNVFMPRSLVSNHIENNLDKYLGEELEFYITEYNPIKRRSIADRKKILVENAKKEKEEALANIHEGDVIDGVVKSVVDYGAFINVGNIDGLLHSTEIGWGRTPNPKKLFNVGDTVRVLVKEIKGDKISLTAKFPDEDPWLLAKTEFSVGKVLKGTVARISDYGAFVKLNDYIDGLLHISEISRDKIKKVSDVLKVGDEVEVKVIDLDTQNKRVSLSMKALLPEPEKKESDDIVDIDIEEYAKNIKE